MKNECFEGHYLSINYMYLSIFTHLMDNHSKTYTFSCTWSCMFMKVKNNGFVFSQPGMKQKLEQIAQELDWIERMDITVEREEDKGGEGLKTTATSTPSSEKSIHDDFQREMRL